MIRLDSLTSFYSPWAQPLMSCLHYCCWCHTSSSWRGQDRNDNTSSELQAFTTVIPDQTNGFACWTQIPSHPPYIHKHTHTHTQQIPNLWRNACISRTQIYGFISTGIRCLVMFYFSCGITTMFNHHMYACWNIPSVHRLPIQFFY